MGKSFKKGSSRASKIFCRRFLLLSLNVPRKDLSCCLFFFQCDIGRQVTLYAWYYYELKCEQVQFRDQQRWPLREQQISKPFSQIPKTLSRHTHTSIYTTSNSDYNVTTSIVDCSTYGKSSIKMFVTYNVIDKRFQKFNYKTNSNETVLILLT